MFASPQLVSFLSKGCLVPGKTWYGAAICKDQANGLLTVRVCLQAQLQQPVKGLVLGASRGSPTRPAVGGEGRVSVVGLPASEEPQAPGGSVHCLFKLAWSHWTPNLC